MASLSLTQVATAAAQFLMVLDSGEGLSSQQLADALAAVNSMVRNWTNEQVQALKLALQSYTLAGGTYTPAATIQFPDTVSSITIPDEYVRVFELGAAVQVAP